MQLTHRLNVKDIELSIRVKCNNIHCLHMKFVNLSFFYQPFIDADLKKNKFVLCINSQLCWNIHRDPTQKVWIQMKFYKERCFPGCTFCSLAYPEMKS